MYFSTNRLTYGARKRPEQRAIPLAINQTDFVVFELGHVQEILRRRRPSLWAGDAVAWKDKGSWIGGVKHSCER